MLKLQQADPSHYPDYLEEWTGGGGRNKLRFTVGNLPGTVPDVFRSTSSLQFYPDNVTGSDSFYEYNQIQSEVSVRNSEEL